jgi:hypothetical protein
VTSKSKPPWHDFDSNHFWATRDEVVAAMGSLPLTKDDDAWLVACVRAANRLVREFRPELPIPTREGEFTGEFDGEFDNEPGWVDPMIRYGTIQLVIEMYRRRGLSSGESVAGMSEFGPPPSSLSYESQTFLALGRHHAPVIA